MNDCIIDCAHRNERSMVCFDCIRHPMNQDKKDLYQKGGLTTKQSIQAVIDNAIKYNLPSAFSADELVVLKKMLKCQEK